MKKMLLTALVVLCCCTAFSQTDPSLRGKKLKEAREQMQQWQRFNPPGNAPSVQAYADTFKRRQAPPINQMPIARLDQRKPRFLFNNGKGMDVYAAATDNMHILRPDSTFYSNMPVK